MSAPPPASDTPTSKRRRSGDATSGEPASKAARRITTAYLCMEFAVREGIELYSGGLGILAGDVVKTAYDRNLPLFGVGILWDEGYVKQSVDKDGKVKDEHPKADRSQFVPVEGDLKFKVTIRGEDVPLRAFTVQELGNKLYLIEPKEEKHRSFTRRLYQGGDGDRLAQEIILGVGAVRLMQAMGQHVDFYQFNEGHAVFAGLELVHQEMTKNKLPFEKAVEVAKKSCLFTTHTPVKAGNEHHQIAEVLSAGIKSLGFTAEQLKKVGGEPFGMTEAAFALSIRANAVAKLHAETASKMWEHLKPVPKIIAITNGVHVPSWQDGKIRAAYEEEATKAEESDTEVDVPEKMEADPVWVEHMKAKERLIAEVKKRTGVELSPTALTVGFARRAATYKRHTLIFYQTAANMDAKMADPKATEKPISADEKKLLEHVTKGEIQVVYSGKAHPNDDGGKKQIELISREKQKVGKALVYLDNYDMAIGKLLTSGCDIWLNNPVRPMEASGTSGMKAAMNGVLNCSILDGWWPEGCVDGVTGWQIGQGEQTEPGPEADDRDGKLLQKLLNEKILICYGEPEKKTWRRMMRASIKMSQWQFSSDRMMNDYADLLYGEKKEV